MEETRQELTLVDEIQNSSKAIYTSLDITTQEDKIKLYNVMQKCDFAVAEHLNEKITLKDIVLQEYEKTNDETGEIEKRVRIMLIDINGKSYGSASKGLFNSLKNIVGMFGMPNTWSEPLPIMISESKTKKGQKTYTISIAE